MKNFKQPGDILTLTAPTGGVTVGVVYVIGGVVGVATGTVAATLPFQLIVEGVFELVKATGAWTEGQALYWDATNLNVSTSAAVGVLCGTATAAAASGDATGFVKLPESPVLAASGGVYNARTKFTVSAINAGATLVAAIAGKKIRMITAKAVAVGGAAGAVTTVDILGTQATASVKLVAFAQASLTQSAVLTAGGTGAAVLADAASFEACDAGAAVTVAKTGSSVTTATHIAIDITYAVE